MGAFTPSQPTSKSVEECIEPNGSAWAISPLDWLLVFGALCIGAMARSYGLAQRGLWYDEADTWHRALSGTYSPHDAPLNQWLCLGYMWFTNDTSPAALHVVPAVFGYLAVMPAFSLGRDLGGRHAGIVCAWLTAVVPPLVYYSQEARPYGLFILVSSSLLAITVRATLRPTRGAYVRVGLACLICAVSHALSTHVAAAIVISLLLMYIWPARGAEPPLDRPRFFAELALVVTLCSAMGLTWMLGRPMLTVLSGPYPHGLLDFAMTLLPGIANALHYAHLDWHPMQLMGALTFALLAAWGAMCLKNEPRKRCGLLILLALPTLTAVILFATLGDKGYGPWLRYSVHLAVPYMVLVSVGAVNVAAHMPAKKRWVGAAVVSAVVIMSLIPGWQWWAEDATHNRSQRFIDTARALEQLGSSLSGVIVHDEYWDTDVRTLLNLQLQRREELPTYVLLPDYLPAVSTHASLADLTDMPVVNWTLLTSLVPGAYAVISSQRTCKQLPVRYGRWSPAEIELDVRGTVVCTLQPGTRNPQ